MSLPSFWGQQLLTEVKQTISLIGPIFQLTLMTGHQLTVIKKIPKTGKLVGLVKIY